MVDQSMFEIVDNGYYEFVPKSHHGYKDICQNMMNAIELNTLNQINNDREKYAKDITSHLAFQFLVDAYELLTHDDNDSDDYDDIHVRQNIVWIRKFLTSIQMHIFEQTSWLTVQKFGEPLFNHLTNPKKPKTDNRQKQYKQYKKHDEILECYSCIRNFKMHYKQQPLALREAVFNLTEVNDSNDLKEYLNWWNTKFPNILDILYSVFSGVSVPSLAKFYPNRTGQSRNLLDCRDRAEYFRKIMTTFRIDSTRVCPSLGGLLDTRFDPVNFGVDPPLAGDHRTKSQHGLTLIVSRNGKNNFITGGKRIAIDNGDEIFLEEDKDEVLVLLKVKDDTNVLSRSDNKRADIPRRRKNTVCVFDQGMVMRETLVLSKVILGKTVETIIHLELNGFNPAGNDLGCSL